MKNECINNDNTYTREINTPCIALRLSLFYELRFCVFYQRFFRSLHRCSLFFIHILCTIYIYPIQPRSQAFHHDFNSFKIVFCCCI